MEFKGYYFILALTLLATTELSAQSNQVRKSIEAYPLQETDVILLDGNLFESFWEKVPVATDFLQQEPVENSPATERTEVRVSYDKNNLYIAVMLYDSDPSGIKAFQKRRDQPLDTDDRFMFILDTYNDQRSAYYFEINPAGLMGDGLLRVGQGTNFNKAWDGIWRVWVKRGDHGWSAEIRIPFMTLNFNPDNEIWGINFQRTVRRKNEETLWAGNQRHQGLFRPQDAGQLTGLKNLSQGIGLEANPYALVTHVRQKENGVDDVSLNAGGEISYSITPNLRAAVTVNTDFAETEVDDRQVNLTRFPLLFPERRAFFLEGSSNYVFAASSFVNPYFSRRIGLQENQPIPIRMGGRINGRINRTDLYFLQVRTAEDGDRPAEDFTVGRVLQNISSESTIGAIYTRRGTAGDTLPVQHTFGTDLEMNTSRFLGNKNLQFQAYFVSHTPTSFEDTTSFFDRTVRGMRINFPNQPWSGHVSYREYAINYDPAVGFVPRIGIKRLQPSIAYSPLLEKSSLIREISFQYYFEYLMEMDFRPATVNHRLRVLGLRFESGDNIIAELTHNYEYLDFNFDILRDNRFVIPIGEYNNRGYRVSFNTASFRRVGANVTFQHYGFWTGMRDDVEFNLFLRPVPGINFNGSISHSDVQLEQGSFSTQIFRFITGIDFSQWVSLNFNVQYDNVTQILATNNRFTWVIQPGNTVYIVYNHNWNRPEEKFATLENRTNFKLSYTHRF
jgi:hypothetical protein